MAKSKKSIEPLIGGRTIAQWEALLQKSWKTEEKLAVALENSDLETLFYAAHFFPSRIATLAQHAINSKGGLAAPLIPLLFDELKNQKHALWAQNQLYAVGAAVIPAAVKALKDKEIASCATSIIARVPRSPKKVIPALIETLTVEDEKAQTGAMCAIGAYGVKAKDAVPYI